MRIACERKKTQLELPGPTWLRMRPHVGPRNGKTIGTRPVRNSGTARKTKDSGRKETVAVPELQRIQEPHRVFLTGDDVFAQVRFPNLNHCRNRNCRLKWVLLFPSCGSCNGMDVSSPQPGTSIVVGIATDDQDPLNNCQDRLVETKSGTYRSGLQKSACGFQNRACELESSACKL